jgi:acyl-CoA thioesterase I
LAAAGLMLAAGCRPRASATAAGAVRIMPLGDSITQGGRGSGSYRRPLWFLLQEAGYRADFVGSQSAMQGFGVHPTDFDTDHEAHWGWRADEILARIEGWTANNRPDIVLLHIGSNDVGTGQDIGETVREIEGIVERLRRCNPEVTVLLAQVIPCAEPEVTDRFRRFNAALAKSAARLGTRESPVLIVDQFTGFNANTDTIDGIHPTEDGARKMAERWFAALRPLLDARGAR